LKPLQDLPDSLEHPVHLSKRHHFCPEHLVFMLLFLRLICGGYLMIIEFLLLCDNLFQLLV